MTKITFKQNNTRFITLLSLLVLVSGALAAKSTFGMQVMIKGHDHDGEYSQHKANRDQHIDHKLLRSNVHLSKMKPIDRRIYEYEQKIRRNKLHQGDLQIIQLRKMLKGVKVYKSIKEVKKIEEAKALQMLKYQPNRAAAIQIEINKRDHSANGDTLAMLVKKKNKSNPFKEVVEMQNIIDEALAPLEKEKLKEKKNMEKQLAGRGMRGLLKKVHP